MKKEIEVLLKRAEGFIKDALEDTKREDHDLAMFHIEQACQLIIKAKLLELTGYFEKTHSLRQLLSDLSKVFKEKEIKEFLEKNWEVFRNLEFAYISSRYLPEEFRREDVEKALKLYEELKKLLWSS